MNERKIQRITNRIKGILQHEIKEEKIAGGQAACFLRGKKLVHVCCGKADVELGSDTGPDTIYRVYSMTKPVTAAAAMCLVEEGRLDLNTPVREYFPEYGMMKVRRLDGRLESADTIRISHLLNMTSGIVYPGSQGVQKEMDDIMEGLKEGGKIGTPHSTREVVRRMAECPLIFQPGKAWNYGFSADVLGAILEEVSGLRLSDLFKKYIFDPLEMYDTGFYVPEEKRGRFAQLYRRTEKGLQIEKERYLGLTLCLEPPAFESAGAGLVSTMEDYSHFANMLACGGIWKERRILREDTVRKFTVNGLNSSQTESVYFPQMRGYGYGYLMRVLVNDDAIPGTGHAGEFGWDGWTGPYFMADLNRNFSILYFLQISAYQDWDVIWKIRNALYEICE